MESGYPTSTIIPQVDGLSTGPPVLGRHSHPSLNNSYLLLTLGEEIVHYPKKTDLLSSLHKREASHINKGTRFLIETTIALNSKSSRKRLTLPSEGRRITTVVFFLFCKLHLTGECPDSPVTLRIQETTKRSQTLACSSSTCSAVVT